MNNQKVSKTTCRVARIYYASELVKEFKNAIIIYMSPVLVFHTKVTVNIGLKEVVRMVTFILLIKCLCYNPERIMTAEL